jgi:hypothetical protein
VPDLVDFFLYIKLNLYINFSIFFILYIVSELYIDLINKYIIYSLNKKYGWNIYIFNIIFDNSRQYNYSKWEIINNEMEKSVYHRKWNI